MAAPASTATATAEAPMSAFTFDLGGRAAIPDTDHAQQSILSPDHRPNLALSLVPPSSRYRRRRQPVRALRIFRSLCRTLPIFNPKCKLPAPCRTSSSTVAPTIVVCSAAASPLIPDPRRRHQNIVTGTLFGYRRSRVSFSIQENPRCLPSVVLELAMQTHALLREMSSGMVRIALECEKKPLEYSKDRHSRVLDEPLWSMFCNGKKSGYAVRREATEEDLAVMETLRAVSMGAGVLPGKAEGEGPEGEMAYVRSGFEHVLGSRDSETLYMTSPDDGNGPDLTIFLVRL